MSHLNNGVFSCSAFGRSLNSPVDSSGRCAVAVGYAPRLGITQIREGAGMAVASVDVPLSRDILDRLSRNESSSAVAVTMGAGVAVSDDETTTPWSGRAPSRLAGCTSRQRAARPMKRSAAVSCIPTPSVAAATSGAGAVAPAVRSTVARLRHTAEGIGAV